MDVMDEPINQRVLADLGEVKGLLRGVTDMIHASEQSTNRRIDDLKMSIDKRMDSLDTQMRSVSKKADAAMTLSTDTAARISRHSALFGGGSGALVAAGIELIIKIYLTHH